MWICFVTFFNNKKKKVFHKRKLINHINNKPESKFFLLPSPIKKNYLNKKIILIKIIPFYISNNIIKAFI